ncbi:MAG: hypoxanthine phosphoribosyltransferase [Clostridiaceae bacterium]|jgi:hypoxanthine phosphoribosyltransferase|nr:hypoxanthine phosphoribosyltransferase [Clostridiaceae bacterium]
MNKLTDDIEQIIITERQIEERVKQLAKEINNYYNGNPIIAVFVLKGSAFFASDLIRWLNMHVVIEFMSVSSYGRDTVSSGKLTIKKDVDSEVKGKDILIIEDIIDTGVTLSGLKEMFKQRGAGDIKVVTMLSKPSRRIVEFEADFTGFEVPDVFVVGYGLDYADKYRNLPYIASLKKHIYEQPNQ